MPTDASAAPAAVQIRAMAPGDADAVLQVYADGIATGHATFEAAVPAWPDWDAEHLPTCRMVAEGDGGVVGWVALSPVSGRCVYGGVAECSVYVSEAARGRGVGLALLNAMIAESEVQGIWSIQAGAFPENVASIRLHERAGFRRIGMRERVGRMRFGPLEGRWRDVMLLERRSTVVGVDEQDGALR